MTRLVECSDDTWTRFGTELVCAGLMLVASLTPVSAQSDKVGITADPVTGNAPLTVKFHGEVPHAGSNPASEQFAWHFNDDGGTANGATVAHTFNRPGTWTATVDYSAHFDGIDAVNTTAHGTLSIQVNATPLVLRLTPAALEFRSVAGDGDPEPQTMTIEVSGGGELSWSVAEGSSAWLTVIPSSGILKEGQPEQLVVHVDSTGMTPGSRPTRLTIVGRVQTPATAAMVLPARSATASTSVTFTVSEAAAPAVEIRPPPPPPPFPWVRVMTIAALLGGGIFIWRKISGRNSAVAPELTVRVTLGSASPSIKTRRPLLSEFLRIRVTSTAGEVRVTHGHRLVGTTTKVKESNR